MKKKIISLAIVGAGPITEEYLKVLKDLKKDVKVTGIFSRTKSKAKALAKKYKISNVCSSLKDLYKRSKANGVLIAVSINSTEKVLSEAMNYPWKSFVEKPVGINFNQAKKLAQLSKRKKHSCYVALNRNFYSSVIKLKNILKTDTKSKRIVIVNDQENIIQAKKEKYPKKIIDNWMYCNSIHLIDFFRIFTRGKLNNVEKIKKFSSSKPSYNLSFLNFSSGDKGIYSCVWNKNSPWLVKVITDNTNLLLKPIEYLCEKKYGNIKEYKISSNDIKYKPGFYLQTKEFVGILKGNIKKSSLPSINDSLITMRNIKKIYF